jgi:hypothetical protein
MVKRPGASVSEFAPQKRGALVERSVHVHLFGFDLRKTTNGESGEECSAVFAVVIFMKALEFVDLHESNARAHSGSSTNSCRF